MTDTPSPARRPFVMELEEPADPSSAPPVPDPLPEGRAMGAAAALATRRGSALGRFARWAFGLAFSFVLSVAVYDFVAGLLARNTVLGWIGFAVLALAILAALALALREWAGYARLSRVEDLRSGVVTARATGDLRAARAAIAGVERLLAGRPEAAWGLSRHRDAAADVLDPDALVDLAERNLMAPLDRLAQAEVEAAARQVAMVTALVPVALADVAAVLFANLRMVRRIAEIYGGRASALGSWQLLRKVFTGLLATGALALTDDLVGSVAGGGLISKLSRRFGEGVVNGALTARVGLAAMEVCRPMPFAATERPGVSATVGRALAGLFGRDDPA